MTAENIMGLVIVGYVMMIMIVIGIWQMRSRNPVGFYTGEKPPAPEELSDVKGWNKEHGLMFIAMGIIWMSFYVIGLAADDDGIVSAVIMIAEIPAMIIFLVFNHRRLVKKYMRKKGE